jgi:hypothetical protein
MTWFVIIGHAQEAASKRARAESPKIGACLEAAFSAVVCLALMGGETARISEGLFAPRKQISLLCIALQQFNYYIVL